MSSRAAPDVAVPNVRAPCRQVEHHLNRAVRYTAPGGGDSTHRHQGWRDRGKRRCCRRGRAGRRRPSGQPPSCRHSRPSSSARARWRRSGRARGRRGRSGRCSSSTCETKGGGRAGGEGVGAARVGRQRRLVGSGCQCQLALHPLRTSLCHATAPWEVGRASCLPPLLTGSS